MTRVRCAKKDEEGEETTKDELFWAVTTDGCQVVWGALPKPEHVQSWRMAPKSFKSAGRYLRGLLAPHESTTRRASGIRYLRQDTYFPSSVHPSSPEQTVEASTIIFHKLYMQVSIVQDQDRPGRGLLALYRVRYRGNVLICGPEKYNPSMLCRYESFCMFASRGI